MDKHLLDILCCPVKKTPIRMLRNDELQHLNQAITRGQIQNVAGDPVDRALQAGLITTDGKVVYRIEDDIPVLLPEEGIGTVQLNEAL
ncbi:hypothetical protein [Oleiagrimonas sp.]|jgi:uncharacterized protein YbaR (Trm112 family)|uniref:Trm112 family protein n=1 Tax=Oleiagrimonas sp. TaxID=2010330 RepID=UPI00263384BD|nr:hypothetical protein [Oleiagrimonas sp.]MDA3913046.1 hypothetical protein [Oleiagrimonas sp.]